MSARKKIKLNRKENDGGNEQNDNDSRIPEDQRAAQSLDGDIDKEGETPETAETISLSPDDIAKLIKEKEEHYDRLLRTQADFDNYRKRVQKEQANLLRYGAENALVEILPGVVRQDLGAEPGAG